MKNTAINTLGYTGIVTLSRYSGEKKIKIAQVHNSGHSPLFNFLSDCLVGDFSIAKLNRPTKIKLLRYARDANGNEIPNTYESASPGFIYLTTTPKKDYSLSGSAVTYSFTIARDYLMGDSFDGIGLYTDAAGEDDSDINNVAGFCAVNKDKFSIHSLSTSAVLVVDWMLTISNVGGTL
jgi:hypothetical protein